MSSFSENTATNLLKEQPINFVKYLFFIMRCLGVGCSLTLKVPLKVAFLINV